MAPNKSRIIGTIIGLLLILGGVYGVFFVDWRRQTLEEPPPIRPLKMITIGDSVPGPVRKYPGKVAAVKEVSLAFQVDGPLIELPILKGQKIRKGELLARIDPRDFQNRLDSAQAQFNQAKIHLGRIQEAVKTGAVSQTDLTNAQASFESAEARLKIAKKTLEDTYLRAPFAAVASNIYVDNYQNVQAKKPIVTIQDISSVDVVVNVPEERVFRADWNRKQPVYRFAAAFDYLPDREFEVTVREYTTEADPLTQTYEVTLTMPAPNEVTILPGMTATVLEYKKEAKEEPDVFTLPIDAVPVDELGQYYVWKLQEKEGGIYTAHRQDVGVRGLQKDRVQVVTGLSRGDKIAASGVHLLQEGQPIRQFIPKSEEAGR
jgi:multidrug efflux system membrane fusion protein